MTPLVDLCAVINVFDPCVNDPRPALIMFIELLVQGGS